MNDKVIYAKWLYESHYLECIYNKTYQILLMYLFLISEFLVQNFSVFHLVDWRTFQPTLQIAFKSINVQLACN